AGTGSRPGAGPGARPGPAADLGTATRAPARDREDRGPLRVPGPEALARVADALAGPLPRTAARALDATASTPTGTP
ncbi:DUF445 domain-containing protein, partial [Streptomyces sp. ISL-12]|nr:DUF445 domain-containing protein [Streptomyces sp. ISL-12]